ncbi:MAG TPA: NADH:flavin oxidoreductase/NADH oxidase [Ktedonobacteraceae bacterium]|jgi:2,4-dienoyl-CoA reductase-like NADH-dependent reductase (Old Yellow Enzyme family)|nr:NADH:flavin oxidoreductase/NADH oxidase [Ktedonobacteraceae bacterium]
MQTLPRKDNETSSTAQTVPLFQPLQIRGITLRNRIAVSPMCQYSSEDGFATDWHLVHLGSRAIGGAAAVITEATAVEARGRISPQDLGIYKDEHIAMLSRITAFIKENGAVPGIQLAHAGRKASTYRPWSGNGEVPADQGGWQTIAPGAIPFAANYPLPREMTKADIAEVVAQFQAATLRALKAGFQIFEIHGAHGYLLHEFLSPVSNRRTDEYGGSLENRQRFLLEVVDAVRKVVPDELPVFVRISASDWVEDGLSIDESIEVARALKQHDVDLIDTSTGGNVAVAQIPVAPNYQVPFAERIRHESGISTGAVGLITESAQANEIIEQGRADLVFLARELLRDPYWPLRAAQELHQDIPWPAQYVRAKLS